MKILFLPNWRIKIAESNTGSRQSPDIFVTNEQYWFFKYWPITNLNVRIIDCGILGKIEKKLFKLHIIQACYAFFISSEYDLIISHGGQSALVLAILRKIFFRNHPPHILIDVAAINGGNSKQPILFLTQFASKKIDMVIYHATMQKEHYKQFFPKLINDSHFIPFGVDLDFFHPLSIVPNEEYILSFGYHSRDWKTLISAYLKAGISTKLLIVGPKKISMPLPPGVSLHPAVSINELKELINNSKFIIIPLTEKKYAHGQMSVLQTMAFAKAVITTNIGAITDYVESERDALLYPLHDSNYLADQILRLENDPFLRKKIGEQGLVTVREKFNEEIMGKNIWEVVKSRLQQ